MNKPDSKKERNLLKGAIRRVFSRSELRRRVIEKALVKDYSDPQRPRVTKWLRCTECQEMIPAYLAQTDHEEPIIPVDKTLDEMDWDTVIDRAWCDERLLKPKCKPCHAIKTKAENKERRRLKKAKEGK